MLQIDFYLLHFKQPPVSSREVDVFVCQLVDKVFQQGLSVYVQAASLADARRLDDVLWTFRQDSFIPHDLFPDVEGSAASVRIGYGAEVCLGMVVLINLSGQVPSFYNEFQRVAEVVADDEESRGLARQRYRFYRDSVMPVPDLKLHDIYR